MKKFSLIAAACQLLSLLEPTIALSTSILEEQQLEAALQMSLAGREEQDNQLELALQASCEDFIGETEEFVQFYKDNSDILANELKTQKESGQITFIQNGDWVTPIARFNVSGSENNCLFRCFGSVNSELKEKGVYFKSRDEYINLLQSFSADTEFNRLVKEGITSDDLATVYNVNSVENYLNIYRDSNLSLPSGATSFGSFPTGLAVALAHISGVHLNVFTYDSYQGAQLVTEYFNVEAGTQRPENTLNLILRDGHYQIIIFPGQEDLHDNLLAYQRENYLRIFYKMENL